MNIIYWWLESIQLILMKFYATLLLVLLIPNTLLANDLMVFGADWCPACVKLKNFIQKNPQVVDKYSVDFVDIDKHPEVKKKLGVTKIPLSIIFNEDGTIKSKILGYDSRSYTQWLKENE